MPADDAAEIRDRASFTVDAVKEREKVTDHDVAAFVDVVAESVGEAGRWVHHGLTSSDVLDTALALQLTAAGLILIGGARDYRDALIRQARAHRGTLCVGRTHGVHAEPTTFGREAGRLRLRGPPQPAPARARGGAGVGGRAVGRGGHLRDQRPRVRAASVLQRLGLAREDVSTQVVARDRHAELLSAIALAGAGLERFATEIRHLQRTEVREVEEPFRAGQKGSSAMPHKRNPIVSERITGIARLLRGYAQAGLEDVALWHERDISHSSVERVALPDATILLDYAQHLAIRRGGRDGGAPGSHARQPRTPPTARSTRSARCWRSWSPAARATTPTGSSRRTPSARGTRGSSSASCWPPRRPGSISTRSSIRAAFVRHAEEIVARLDAI